MELTRVFIYQYLGSLPKGVGGPVIYGPSFRWGWPMMLSDEPCRAKGATIEPQFAF